MYGSEHKSVLWGSLLDIAYADHDAGVGEPLLPIRGIVVGLRIVDGRLVRDVFGALADAVSTRSARLVSIVVYNTERAVPLEGISAARLLCGLIDVSRGELDVVTLWPGRREGFLGPGGHDGGQV